MRENYFTLNHGRIVIQWPAKIDQDEFDDIRWFMDLTVRQIVKREKRVSALIAEHVDSSWEVA